MKNYTRTLQLNSPFGLDKSGPNCKVTVLETFISYSLLLQK